MSWAGWVSSLLAGAVCAGLLWRLCHALARRRRLRYLQAYHPEPRRPAPPLPGKEP